MTITSEPTTTTPVPAWLNTDKLCAPELVAEITALIADAGPMLDMIAAWATRARRVGSEAEAAIASAVQDAAVLVDDVGEIDDGLRAFLGNVIGSWDLFYIARMAARLVDLDDVDLTPAEAIAAEQEERVA